MARQLSADILYKPVPIGAGGTGSPQAPRQEPVGQESEEDYLDPGKATPVTPTTTQPTSPVHKSIRKPMTSIASISEVKKADIMSDYAHGSELNKTVSPRHSKPSDDDSDSQHDYNNVEEFLPSTDMAVKRSSTGADNVPKSPRRPRPMPRNNPGSENSSRKQSLTNGEGGKLNGCYFYQKVGRAVPRTFPELYS